MHKLFILFFILTLPFTAKAEMAENVMIGEINILQAIEIRMAYERELEEVRALYKTPTIMAAQERNRIIRTALSQRDIDGYENVYKKYKSTLSPLTQQITNLHLEMKLTARNVTQDSYQKVLNTFYRDTFVKRAKPLIQAHIEATNKVLDEIERDYL